MTEQTKIKMNLLKTSFLLISLSSFNFSFGQNYLRGTFVYYEGFVYESLTLTKDKKYSYLSANSCTSNSIDSGIYNIVGDTIIFRSTIDTNCFHNSEEVQIGTSNSILDNKEYVDTVRYTIQSYTSFPVKGIDIFYNTNLVASIPRIEANSDSTYSFKIVTNSVADRIKLTLKIGEEFQEVSNTNFVEFTINSNHGNDIIEQIPWKKVLFKSDKIYPMFDDKNFFLKRTE